MQSFRDKKLVYHLTAIDNFEEIARKGILPRSALADQAFTDVADCEILEGRADMGLENFVPFHFIHKSPFDYAVTHRNEGTSFVLLGYARNKARQNGWKVCPRHPRNCPDIYDWDEGVEAVDWEQMDKFPRDYENDHECKMTCMAEALSPRSIPLLDFSQVFVKNSDDEARVRRIMQVAGHVGMWPQVTVNENMIP